MRKIIQYMMMALIAVVLASCANDISEESTPTVKSNIRFVVDDFPMFEKPSTRTIGEEDKGKTAWAVGDEICVKLESKELGTQTATLKYNGVKFEIQDGNSLCYLEGEPVTAYAYYAPGRKYLNDDIISIYVIVLRLRLRYSFNDIKPSILIICSINVSGRT